MDLFVFLAVLGAAACHAGWNTLLKLDLEPLAATTLDGGDLGFDSDTCCDPGREP